MTKKVDFDNYAKNYNQLLKERTSFFSSSEEYFTKYKVDLVRKHVQYPVRRLLEYGCGIGRNISYLKKAFPGAVILGSDISDASLEIARRDNLGVDFFREDVHRHVHQHRPGLSAFRCLEGPLDDLREEIRAIYTPGALDKGPVDLKLRAVRVEVDLLMRMFAEIITGDIPRDHDHRDAIQ